MIHENQVMSGRALTGQYMPKRVVVREVLEKEGKTEGRSRDMVIWPIYELVEGDLYVADSYGKVNDGTIIGDNLGVSIYAKSKNGVVFNGGLSDLEDLEGIEGFNAFVKSWHPSYQMNMNALKRVLDLNLLGTLNSTQIFGEEIALTGNGSIVNISSMTSQRVITKVLGYSMAKSAVDCYTKWFAVELANRYKDALRMNAIAPGFFLTEQNKTLLTNEDGSFKERAALVIKQTPFQRFGIPQELEGALIWLLSDASKFVNGAIINVDGGFSVFGGV